ncbi:hypothetical protein OG329_29980 [Streptomyces sp. NBC_01506]
MPGAGGARGARHRHRDRARVCPAGRRRHRHALPRRAPRRHPNAARACGPFPQARFVPTGGIGAAQLAGYLDEPAVLAVGGNWTATSEHLERGDYEEIRRLTADAVEGSTM